jgi:feruloyl esterase
MIRIPSPVTALRRAALALAGTALASSAAFAGSAGTPCSSMSGSFPNGGTLALSEALGFTGPGTGTPIVLGISAQDVPANALSPGEPSPAVCSVGMVVSSDGNPADSQIQIAVLLPEGAYGTNSQATWNGRFLGTGNGGFAGSIATSTLGLGLIPSYAAVGKTYVVANTDLGDGAGEGVPAGDPGAWYNCNTLFCGSDEGNAAYGQTLGGLYGNAAAITDFGYGATHLMTVASKALITSFYGTGATYSYFHGCSTGGQQALMEAQRFPNDYDGILAGSPAYDRTHLHIASAAFYEVINSSPAGFLTNEALGLAHAAMLQSCVVADGGVAGDDYLMQPSKCSFDATVLQCTGAPTDVPCTDPSGTSCTCLEPAQVASLNGYWSGALDNHGRVLLPGYERGAEDPNAGLIAEGEAVTEPLFDSLDYWAFGPTFTWQSLFANTLTPQGELSTRIMAMDNVAVGGSTFAGVLNANNPDLSAFSANGGKLIMYAGYEDPLIPSASSIDYYNAVRQGDPANKTYAGDPNLANYMRLYLAPGMFHCNGGPGANAFGNLSSNLPPVPGAINDDVLGALTAWREDGITPTKIIATKYVGDNSANGVAFQRPLCPYPQNAKYVKPHQSPFLQTSWECKPGAYVENQKFNAFYGPQ